MWGELVRVRTSGGRRLAGLYCPPVSGAASICLIFIHGRMTNFYEYPFISALAERVGAAGYTFLSTNNSGHDLRASYETFAACADDLAAWVAFAAARGHARVVIVGHSLGAVKATYYLGQPDHPALPATVAGLVLVSPIDAIGNFRQRAGERYGEYLELARTWVEAGKARQIMPYEVSPLPYSAGAFVDRYGADSEIDLFDFFGRGSSRSYQHLARIACPILAFFGSRDEVSNPDQALELLQRHARAAPTFRGQIIEGAGHDFAGHEAEVADLVMGWLEDLEGPSERAPRSPGQGQDG